MSRDPYFSQYMNTYQPLWGRSISQKAIGDPDVSVALLVEEESESHVIRPLVVKET